MDTYWTLYTGMDGPGTPFRGWLALWDSLRVLCMAGGLAMVAQLPGCIRRCFTAGQRARFVALGLWGLLIVVGNPLRIGDWADIRLLVQVAAVGYALYGLWTFRRETPSAPIRGSHAA